MKHLSLPDAALWRRLPFYLAAEEWAARVLPLTIISSPGEWLRL